MHPDASDDTCPIRLPVNVTAIRACRPVLIRVAGPGMGETHPVPGDRRAGVVIGRAPGCGIVVADPVVSREHCRVWSDAQGRVVLSDLGSLNGTIVNGQRVSEVVLVEGDKVQVGTKAVFRFSLSDRLDADYAEHLYQTSIRDVLTGLHNRRYLLEALERDLALARRHGIPVSVILLDVDHFKGVNDTFGHRAGDDVLRQLGKLLSDMQRRESLVARFGGEEFAVLLRQVAPAGAEVFAERMRLAVERAPIQVVGGASIKLTISAGVAVTTTDDVLEADELIERADRYLYQSKARGRNRVSSARTARR